MDNWNWPQWTMASLMFLRLLMYASRNGKPMKGEYSFPVALMGAFLTAFVLWKGGFWK